MLYISLVSIVWMGWRTIVSQRGELESANTELAGRVERVRAFNDRLLVEISECGRAEQKVHSSQA
jgi:hypothetical protein